MISTRLPSRQQQQRHQQRGRKTNNEDANGHKRSFHSTKGKSKNSEAGCFPFWDTRIYWALYHALSFDKSECPCSVVVCAATTDASTLRLDVSKNNGPRGHAT